jgi:uncharacterized oxidoreductase
VKRRKYSHALITGGAGGIGKAMTECFLRYGYRVTLVDRCREALENIRRDWPSVGIAHVDITDTTALRSLVDELGPREDGPDVIVNCAGIHYSAPWTSPGYAICDQLADIDREIRTNVVALAQHCALWRPHLMARTNGAAIVNLASALAFVPKYSSAIYCATKAAVHQFSRVLALQLAGTGITVVTVYPPLVATAMTAGRNAGAMAPAEFAARFYRAFAEGKRTVHIGESKWLHLMHRLSPSLAMRLVES